MISSSLSLLKIIFLRSVLKDAATQYTHSELHLEVHKIKKSQFELPVFYLVVVILPKRAKTILKTEHVPGAGGKAAKETIKPN